MVGRIQINFGKFVFAQGDSLIYAEKTTRILPGQPIFAFASMRTLALAAFVLAVASTSSAQLNPLPASSTMDGIFMRSFGGESANQVNWSGSSLNDYRLGGATSFTPPSGGGTDEFGRAWSTSAPSLTAVANNGGTFRAIFLGAASGSWLNGVGYAYSGDPTQADAFTMSDAPNRLQFGETIDVPLLRGDADIFDYWLSTANGTYTLLHPEQNPASAANAQVLWTASPLLVDTYIPALGHSSSVETWIVDFTELSNDPAANPREFRFAFQQYSNSGAPTGNDPIPEPSVYGLIGAAGLGSLAVARRRFRRIKTACPHSPL